MFTGTLTGIVGRDPELRYLDDGSQVANFSIAVRQARRQGQDPPARWVKVSIWGKAAQFVGDYIHKGDRVLLWGDVQAPEMYTNRQGEVAISERFKAANIEKLYEPQQGAPAPAAAAPAPAPQARPQQPAQQEIHPAYAAAGHVPQATPPRPAPAPAPIDDNDPPF